MAWEPCVTWVFGDWCNDTLDIISMIVCSGVPTSGGHYETHLIAPSYAEGSVISIIARWLGHENPATTHHYVEADLTMKERALARLHESDVKIQRCRAPDSLIDFLKTL